MNRSGDRTGDDDLLDVCHFSLALAGQWRRNSSAWCESQKGRRHGPERGPLAGRKTPGYEHVPQFAEDLFAERLVLDPIELCDPGHCAVSLFQDYVLAMGDITARRWRHSISAGDSGSV
jgi:hypothetical protein